MIGAGRPRGFSEAKGRRQPVGLMRLNEMRQWLAGGLKKNFWSGLGKLMRLFIHSMLVRVASLRIKILQISC